MKYFSLLMLLSSSLWLNAQTTITLTPAKDNTLYEDTEGDVSNGVGIHIFAGQANNGSNRRALMAFSIGDQVPAGASVTDVSLSMNVNKQRSGAATVDFSLHRVSQDWGEGSSNAGNSGDGDGTNAANDDATWVHAFFDTDRWTSAGGDFVANPSATTAIDGLGGYAWSSAGMVADVQAWVDDPSSNFGWILIGDESVQGAARRFVSRENSNEADRPTLSVTYTVPSSISSALSRQVQTYPNPVTDQLTVVSRDVTGTLTLELLDLQGRRLQQQQMIGSGQTSFSLANLPAGMYLLRMRNGQETAVRKVMHR